MFLGFLKVRMMFLYTSNQICAAKPSCSSPRWEESEVCEVWEFKDSFDFEPSLLVSNFSESVSP